MHTEARIDAFERRFDGTLAEAFKKIDDVGRSVDLKMGEMARMVDRKIGDVAAAVTEVSKAVIEMRAQSAIQAAQPRSSVWQWIGGGAGLMTISGALLVGLFFLIDSRVDRGMTAIKLQQEHDVEIARIRREQQAEIVRLRLDRIESAMRWKANLE